MSAFRYITLIWRPEAIDQAACVEALASRLSPDRIPWDSVRCGDGLHVFHRSTSQGSDRCHALPAGAGVVLGTIFSRKRADSPESDSDSNPPDLHGSAVPEQIISTRGRCLLEHCWGRYVGILYDRPEQATRIIRDPSGTMPCLMTAFRGVKLVFSHPEDLIRLGALTPAPNWHYIGLHAKFPQINSRETALTGVSEVCAGECVDFKEQQQSHTFLWHPARFARVAAESARETLCGWVQVIHSTTKQCVHAWASGYPSILHRLSGGLDSTVVLACLRDAPHHPQIIALNYYSDLARGDERRYARAAAAQAHVSLLERRIDSEVNLSRILNVRLSARPGFYWTSIQFSDVESSVAREFGAKALFNGGWGDQLFYRSRNDYPAFDYIERHGFSGEWFITIRDSAAMTGTTWWRVLRRLLRYRVHRPSLIPALDAVASASLLHPELNQCAGDPQLLLHPWFDDTQGVPFGKLWHIFLLSGPVDLQRPFPEDDDPDSIAPLRSQPLMEQCLQIPTYVLTLGGADRPVPRIAFQAEIPDLIARRLSKGLVDESFQGVVRHNLPFVRELLLDGLLVKEKILDATQLEQALGDPAALAAQPHPELLSHICTEAWLQRCEALKRTGNAHRHHPS